MFDLFALPIKTPEIVGAAEAAVAAGERIIALYAGAIMVNRKAENEPVTAADIESNGVIVKLLEAFGYPIISEESGGKLEQARSSRVWIVDPLDGTQDFINHTGEFSVLIGLVENGIPVLGVIYEPFSHRMYLAEKGKGAFVITAGTISPIQASHVSSIVKSTAIMSRNHLTAREERFLKDITPQVVLQRGSTGLKIAEICHGAAEFYFTEAPIKIWDTCAAHCLLNEAGGRCSDLLGNEIVYNQNSARHENGILATNSHVHEELARAYKKFKVISA